MSTSLLILGKSVNPNVNSSRDHVLMPPIKGQEGVNAVQSRPFGGIVNTGIQLLICQLSNQLCLHFESRFLYDICNIDLIISVHLIQQIFDFHSRSVSHKIRRYLDAMFFPCDVAHNVYTN